MPNPETLTVVRPADVGNEIDDLINLVIVAGLAAKGLNFCGCAPSDEETYAVAHTIDTAARRLRALSDNVGSGAVWEKADA